MGKALPSAVLAAAIVAGTPSGARAGEDDRSLSVSLSYGLYSIPDHSPSGSVLGLDYERGFSEALSFRASTGAGVYFADEGRSYSGHLVVGITYLLDVLKYVPYVNLGVGGILLGGGGVETDLSALLEMGVGLDVLHSRSFSYGVVVRFESYIQETSFFTAGARLTWRWGFF
jgi:hypothetical protein